MSTDHLSAPTPKPILRVDEECALDRENQNRKFQNVEANRRIRTTGHISKLDSLRGAAILLVLIYHSYGGSIDYRNWSGLPRYFLYLTRYGYTGVQLFFVLSGFLITTILLYAKQDKDFYGSFYKRRALRILPAYLALLIVIKIWLGVSWKYIAACLLYIANMAGLVGAKTSEYGPLWSLAVEEQFYLLWPLCVRRLTKENLFKLTIGICCVLPLLRLLAAALSPTIDIRYKTYFIADYLAYGALIAIAIDREAINRSNIQAIAKWLFAIGVLFASGAMYVGYRPIHSFYVGLISRSIGVLPFVWVYCGLVLCAIYRHDSGDANSNSFLDFFGYISYGLYLIHEFIFYEYGKLTFGTRLAELNSSFAMATLRFAVVGGISVFVAYISRRFYEEYFLRIGRAGRKVSAPSFLMH